MSKMNNCGFKEFACYIKSAHGAGRKEGSQACLVPSILKKIKIEQ